MKSFIFGKLKHLSRLFLLLAIFITCQAEAQQLKRRASLGLRTTILSDSLAKAHSIKSGVIVTRVVTNSTAEVLGVKQGDIILSINKQPVQTPAELTSIGQLINPGQIVTMQLLREGKKKV